MKSGGYSFRNKMTKASLAESSLFDYGVASSGNIHSKEFAICRNIKFGIGTGLGNMSSWRVKCKFMCSASLYSVAEYPEWATGLN